MMRLLRVPLCLAILALVLGSPVRLGAVQPPEPDVTGIWNGFFISNTVEGDAGVVRLVIDSQKNRRFGGTLHVNPGSGFEIPFDGTLAASGHFTVIGNGPMGRFVVTGQYQEGARGVQYANAQYRLWVPGQPIDEGTLDLLQVPKQPAAQDLGGAWQGT